GQNLASNEKAESILKSVFELKQAVSKDKKAKFSFERIPMFDDVKVDEKMYASIAAYSKTAKELKTTETVIGLQKHVQKETEADLAQAKISFYDDCKKMLLTSLGKCKGFANSTKLLGQCYGRESQAETKRLLDHATGMKTFAARLKTEK
ncbi:MAG: hypothetical protein V4692_10715, partial [Bdellovibrionota bacterium]